MNEAKPVFRSLEPDADLFVVADVHGDFDAFSAALETAPAGAFVLQLGDLVDRGPFSPLCVEAMLDRVETGRGAFIAGNHDVALAEVVEGARSATPARAETLDQFAAYSEELLARFVAAVRAAPLCLRAGRFAFAHAAWSPRMETEQSWSDDLRRLALQGERRAVEGARRPATSYAWVDRIPKDRVVVVGHDVRGRGAPLTCENAQGGAAVFLDLGCGEGGPLGCATLRDGELALCAVAPPTP